MKRGSEHAGGQEKALEAVAGLIREQAAPPTTEELQYGLQGLFTRLATRDVGRHPGWWRWSLAGLGATACVAALAFGVIRPRLQPAISPAVPALPALTYQVQGGNLIAGGYLRQSSGEGIKLSFSEGTEFVLMPGTHGRLRSVGAAGARIAIEQGTAYFQVTPNSGRTWLVDVGPFLVTVKGTVFTVSWDPLRERFELRLRRGRVVVSGPVSGGDIVLRQGQRLTVDLPGAQTLITEDKDSPPGRAEAPHGPAFPVTHAGFDPLRPVETVAPGRARSTASPLGRSARAVRPLRWDVALASGDWDAILSDADRAGVREILEAASSEDLFALADAARYRRRPELAREALLAQRRRFPASARASDAAFLLGRVEEASGGDAARALRWYDEYLARAPAGTYASEALGRRMTLIKQKEGGGRARPIAEDYLRRFPDGTYAGSARALLH